MNALALSLALLLPASSPVRATLPNQQPVPAPRLYRLADLSGQVWTHADPRWLASYVAQRNVAITAQWARSPIFAGGCANGRCGR